MLAFGGPHAEVAALEEAGEAAGEPRSTSRSNPAATTAKRPLALDAILPAGIARVVAAMRDPFPSVDGGGVAVLREAGVQVESGSWPPGGRSSTPPT